MIVDWFTTLFDANGFQTRGQCGPWSESLVRVYIVSNGLITLAYLIIAARPCMRSGNDAATTSDCGWMILLFRDLHCRSAALTHACDVAVFWWPGYRLFTLASIVTAFLSVSRGPMRFPG